MQSFYVDITKCRTAEKDLAACEGDLKSASRKLDSAGDGLRGMSGGLSLVGQSVEHLARKAQIESKEVEQLRQVLHNILDLYYTQEAGLIGQAVGNGVQNIESVLDKIKDIIGDVGEFFGDKAEDFIDRYIRTLIDTLGGDFINDDGTINLGGLAWNVFTTMTSFNMNVFDKVANGIITAQGGKLMELFVDLYKASNLDDIDINYYDFLKKIDNFDIGQIIGDQFKLSTFDFSDFSKLSKLGKCCKIVGIFGEVVDVGIMIGEDFCDVFYNEETGTFEGFDSVNNWGYFATDVVIDGVVKIGSNIIGDIVGTAAGAGVASLFGTGGAAAGAAGGTAVAPGAGTVGGAVAGGVTAGGVAAVVTQSVVSALVSNGIEDALNADCLSFIDIDGDGTNDSAVDSAKYIAHNLVDNVVEIVPQAYEATTEFVGNMVETVSEHAGEVVNTVTSAASDIYDSATEFAGEVYSTVSETASNVYESVTGAASEVVSNTASYVEDLLGISWF
ncbi:MAG: hypothetical protein E7263_07145 [Lachnospiraceae bacterium]|nr:hypothetical protein [Lachnospiraceae bacterium]